jgi:hypothetical protein
LNDVFAVEAVPVDDGDVTGAANNAEDDILDPDQSQRLQALFDLRDQRPLTPDEQAEMRALVAEYGHRVHERGVRELAQRRNLPLEQVRAEVAADFERALAWWDEVQADPARLEALVNEARERQRAHADG